MATQTVTISLSKEGVLSATPDTVEVNPGDVISWELDKGLSWPRNIAGIIVPKKGYNSILGPLELVDNTIQATVNDSAPLGYTEHYIATVTATGSDEVIPYNDPLDSFDPKIKVNPK